LKQIDDFRLAPFGFIPLQLISFLLLLAKFSFTASNGPRSIQQPHPTRNIDLTEPEISDLKSCGIEAKLGLFQKSPDTSQHDLR
jgi:hypothetical protein